MEETLPPTLMFHSSGISAGKSAKIAADLKAFAEKYGHRDVHLYTMKPRETNPCNEIIFGKCHMDYEQFKQEYKAEFIMEEVKPHSERVNKYGNSNGIVSGDGLSGKFNVTDEEVTLIVDVPGVDENLIEIKQIDNVLRIRLNPENPEEFDIMRQSYPQVKELQMILTDREKVEDVHLDLGRLTISLNRGREVTTYEL